MRLLIFDPRFGAAGDMILSSLLSLGADTHLVFCAVSDVASPSLLETTRAGIPALSLRTNTGNDHRTIEDIFDVLDKAPAPEDAKALAKKVFLRILKAEETVHQSHHVHFHEVGADDAIADVLGSCTALLSLHPDAVSVLPLATGFGSLTCSHGIMPVPAPATAEILKQSSLEIMPGSFEGELCTPTGAALLAEFAASYPAETTTGRLLAIGRGAGTRDPSDHPNILSAYLLESGGNEGSVDVLETNVDDVSGEVLTRTLARLIEEGARDASLVPIIMKKGRSGYLIRVVCMPSDSQRLAKFLARETGSLGIRCTPMIHRFVADRGFTSESVEINGKIYTSSVKHGSMDGVIYSRKAEFEDCIKISDAASVPVKDVKRIIEGQAWKHC